MTAVGYNHINAFKMSSTTSAPKTNKMAKKTAPAPAPAVAPVTATPAAPVKESKPKAAKAPKATASKVEVVVPTTAAPVVPAVAAPVQSSDALLTSLTEQLKALSTEFTTRVRDAVKGVQEAAKAAKKEARDSKKKRKVDPATLSPEARAAWEARRANNAFLKQKPLTPELAAFMGIAAGSKRSQTEVTKFISDYVKSHNCYDPNFKRRIIPNAALAKLLRVDDKTEVTYLNLQRFLKVHFVKTA
jgi:chromatin remodeling complex protein RSC6